jgi:hypothetical protein
MNSLAKLAIDAHGGLDRWKQFETVSAHLVQGGMLWQIKGQAGTLDKTNVTVGLRRALFLISCPSTRNYSYFARKSHL